MAGITTPDSFFTRAIEAEVRAEIKRITNKFVKQAAAEMEKTMELEADRIALSILKIYDIRMGSDNIVITVKKASNNV